MEKPSIYNEKIAEFKFEKSHFDLVKRIAKSIVPKLPSHVCFEDVLQSGMIGLMDAASRFDSEKGVLFTTYATIRIRGSIMDDLRRSGWIPRSVQKTAKELSNAVKKVEDEQGRTARQSEIASSLHLNIGDYHALLNDVQAMQLASYDDDSQNFSEQFEYHFENPLDSANQEMIKRILRKELAKLPEREKNVLLLYYIDEMGLKEIGNMLGVSESRVSQIHHLATENLGAKIRGQFNFNDAT